MRDRWISLVGRCQAWYMSRRPGSVLTASWTPGCIAGLSTSGPSPAGEGLHAASSCLSLAPVGTTIATPRGGLARSARLWRRWDALDLEVGLVANRGARRAHHLLADAQGQAPRPGRHHTRHVIGTVDRAPNAQLFQPAPSASRGHCPS